jgi:type I restriction enzyme S subunit
VNEQQTKLVPKLRFPEFRGAEGWKAEPMGGVYSFRGNNSLSRDKLNYVAGSVKNIHYGDIHTKFSSHFDITKELVPFINESELSTVRDENRCVEGDMIFADASEDMADIGKCIELVRLNGERLVSGLHTILARRTGDRIALGFGGHLFKSGWVRAQIQKEAQGAKVLGISANRMRNLRLPLPPAPAEQQKIADCLSSLDELIAAQARKVDALKTHKKGLMQQLFPREGETQPRLRFPEFRDTGDWEETTLGAYFDPIRNGFVGTATPYYTTSEGVRYLQGRNIKQGKIEVDNLIFITNDFHNRQRKSHLKTGDILMVQSGHVGECAVVGPDFEGANCHALVILTPRRKLSSEFFGQYFYAPIGELAIFQITTGNTIKHILASELKTLPVLVPGLTEQKRIADCLTTLDTLITAAIRELETLKTHKKGLMQQLFPQAEALS